MSTYKPVRHSDKEFVNADSDAGRAGPYSGSLPSQTSASVETALVAMGSAGTAPAAAAPAAAALPVASPLPAVSATLWVGGLDKSVTEDDLFDSFQTYGFVTDVNMMNVSSVGQSQAFVKFQFYAEADKALSASLNRQLRVKGKTVTCRWAQQETLNEAQRRDATLSIANSLAAISPDGQAPKLWVGNLPMGTTEAELRDACAAFGGEVVDIIIFHKPSQYGQLSGFLRLKTQVETDLMLRAIASGAMRIKGAAIKADWARAQ